MSTDWTAEASASLKLPDRPRFSPLVGLTHSAEFTGFDVGVCLRGWLCVERCACAFCERT